MTALPHNDLRRGHRRPHVATGAPANGNALVELRHTGDGRAVYRALARVIARRELIFAGVIADWDRCGDQQLAG